MIEISWHSCNFNAHDKFWSTTQNSKSHHNQHNHNIFLNWQYLKIMSSIITLLHFLRVVMNMASSDSWLCHILYYQKYKNHFCIITIDSQVQVPVHPQWCRGIISAERMSRDVLSIYGLCTYIYIYSQITAYDRFYTLTNAIIRELIWYVNMCIFCLLSLKHKCVCVCVCVCVYIYICTIGLKCTTHPA
jgi:hypothetical protein